jgi:hypothetical protein
MEYLSLYQGVQLELPSEFANLLCSSVGGRGIFPRQQNLHRSSTGWVALGGEFLSSHSPSEEHVGIIQEFEEVQCFSQCETRHLLVVFIRMVFPCQLPVAYLHLYLQCTKSKAQEFEGIKHASAQFIGKNRIIQPLFWIKNRWRCGGLHGRLWLLGLPRGGGIAMVVLWAAQRLSRRGPCPQGAKQAARGHGYCGAAPPPMRVVAQRRGHRNGVSIG